MNLVASEENISTIRKWRSYPKYKESNVEWLGKIPAHWETIPLKHVAEFVNGLAFKPAEWGSEGIPIIRIENLNRGDEFNYVTLKVPSKYHVSKGDLLFGWSGNRGTSFGPFIWPRDGLHYLNQHIFKIQKFESDKIWLYWVLKEVTHYVEKQAHGIIGMVHITSGDLGIIPVPQVCEQEQLSIAAFLERETARIDALVAKKEHLIELLQEKRAALITRAVTKGLDQNVPMKDSGVEWLGKIPAHWEVKRIKHLAKILRGKFSHRPRNDPILYDGPYPFIQTGDIASANKYLREYQQTLNENGYAVSKEFPNGTLVMAIAANIGDLAILGFQACFPDSIVGFVPERSVKLEFLYYNLTAMRPEMLGAATLNTQMNLNIDRIGSLFTVQPPDLEQGAIVELINRETAEIDSLIAKIREGIEKLKEYRTALISAAVTGKIDVRGNVN